MVGTSPIRLPAWRTAHTTDCNSEIDVINRGCFFINIQPHV